MFIFLKNLFTFNIILTISKFSKKNVGICYIKSVKNFQLSHTKNKKQHFWITYFVMSQLHGLSSDTQNKKSEAQLCVNFCIIWNCSIVFNIYMYTYLKFETKNIFVDVTLENLKKSCKHFCCCKNVFLKTKFSIKLV